MLKDDNNILVEKKGKTVYKKNELSILFCNSIFENICVYLYIQK